MNKALFIFEIKRHVFKMIPIRSWRKKMLATLPPKHELLVYSAEQLSDFHNLLKRYPNILSVEQTFDDVINQHLSFSRIGDGEFNLMINERNIFNKCNEQLRRRLIDICETSSQTCLVCLNRYTDNSKWWLYHGLKYLPKVLNQVSFKADTYGDAYFLFGCISDINKTKDGLEKVKTLWRGRKVLFVCRTDSFVRKDKLNIFSEVAAKAFLDIPATDAFDRYDEILKAITEYPKDWKIYLECGATASVLAWDLSHTGYQAWDMGDFYKRLTRIMKDE